MLTGLSFTVNDRSILASPATAGVPPRNCWRSMMSFAGPPIRDVPVSTTAWQPWLLLKQKLRAPWTFTLDTTNTLISAAFEFSSIKDTHVTLTHLIWSASNPSEWLGPRWWEKRTVFHPLLRTSPPLQSLSRRSCSWDQDIRSYKYYHICTL